MSQYQKASCMCMQPIRAQLERSAQMEPFTIEGDRKAKRPKMLKKEKRILAKGPPIPKVQDGSLWMPQPDFEFYFMEVA